MSSPFIEACLAQDFGIAQKILGFAPTSEWMSETEIMELRLSQMKEDPTLQPWLLRALIDKKSGMMVGHFNAHTKAGPEYLKKFTPLNAVEIGFTIYTPFRKSGFATEAIEGFSKWLKTQKLANGLVLSILTTNTPSLNLAKKLGFQKIGQVVEGPDTELVFLREI
jgi:RimJ/RimL family protein N-acetyltransferase